MHHLETCRDLLSTYSDNNTASIMSWCTPSIVSKTYVDLQILDRMLLKAVLQECCRKGWSNHGVLQWLRPSIAERNLTDKYVVHDTCQIMMVPQIPTHMSNYRLDANTRTRITSPYGHIHTFPKYDTRSNIVRHATAKCTSDNTNASAELYRYLTCTTSSHWHQWCKDQAQWRMEWEK